MRYLMFLVLILPTLLFAQTVDLQKHYVPALSQVLFDDNRRAITLVETPEIKDNAGNLARGVHTIHFSLDASSPFPVVVEGRTVQPGETYVFTHNLSNSGHRLSLPIHPATAFVSGAAEYTLSLPSLFIEMCPAGFTKGDVDCYRIDFAEPIVECPSGFTVLSGQCSKTITMSKTFGCASGYTRSGDTCSISTSTPVEKICPATHFMNQAGRCELVESSKPLRCELGFEVDGTQCVKRETQPITEAGCPDGFSEAFGQCEKVTYQLQGHYCANIKMASTPSCTGSGLTQTCYVYNETLGSCDKSTFVDVVSICPANTTMSGSNCVYTDAYNIVASCPAGYTRTNGSCSKYEIKDANKSCLTGYTMSGTTCSKVENQSIVSCPTGYAKVGSTCHVTTPINISCPTAGYSWNGSSCVKPETQAATPICQSGYSWNGSSCVKPETQAATPVCQSGYSYNGTSCRKIERIEATVKNCQPGYIIDTERNLCTKGLIPSAQTCPSFSAFLISGGEPLCLVATSIQFRCINGTTAATSGGFTTCSGSTYPSSMEIVNGYNISTNFSADFGLISNAQSLGGGWSSGYYTTSYREQKALIVLTCANGYTHNPDFTYYPNVCERTLTASPSSYSCPSGWSVTGSNCNRTLTASPSSYSCPSGWSVTGSACNRTLTQTENRTCNSNYRVLNTSTCHANAASNNIGNCNTGFTVSGTVCTRTLTQGVNYSCDATWAIKDVSRCDRTLTEAAAINCPAEFSSTGSNCTQTQTDPGIKTCPNPYVRVDNIALCRNEIRVPFL
jgi:hypothetical protein